MAALEELQARLAAEAMAAAVQRHGLSMSDQAAAYAQRLFYAGSGRLSLSVAGNVRALISNPADSDRITVVTGLSAFATATGWAELRRNPDIGLPAGTRPVNNARGASLVTAKHTVAVDVNATTALGGGIATGVVLGIPGGDREPIDTFFELDPGESLGINIPFAGAADASFTVYTRERDA